MNRTFPSPTGLDRPAVPAVIAALLAVLLAAGCSTKVDYAAGGGGEDASPPESGEELDAAPRFEPETITADAAAPESPPAPPEPAPATTQPKRPEPEALTPASDGGDPPETPEALLNDPLFARLFPTEKPDATEKPDEAAAQPPEAAPVEPLDGEADSVASAEPSVGGAGSADPPAVLPSPGPVDLDDLFGSAPEDTLEDTANIPPDDTPSAGATPEIATANAGPPAVDPPVAGAADGGQPPTLSGAMETAESAIAQPTPPPEPAPDRPEDTGAPMLTPELLATDKPPSAPSDDAPPSRPEQPIRLNASNTRHLAWLLGAKASVVTLADVAGVEAARNSRWEIDALAGLLGVATPPSVDPGDADRSINAAISALIRQARTSADELSERHGPDHAALMEIALKTNALLVLYETRPELAGAVRRATGRAVERAGLPAEAFAGLDAALDAQSPPEDVREAVHATHRAIELLLRDGG